MGALGCRVCAGLKFNRSIQLSPLSARSWCSAHDSRTSRLKIKSRMSFGALALMARLRCRHCPMRSAAGNLGNWVCVRGSHPRGWFSFRSAQEGAASQKRQVFRCPTDLPLFLDLPAHARLMVEQPRPAAMLCLYERMCTSENKITGGPAQIVAEQKEQFFILSRTLTPKRILRGFSAGTRIDRSCERKCSWRVL